MSLTIVNVYAPTIDKRLDQVTFINTVSERLENYHGGNIVIGGDLNINMDISATDTLHCKNPGYSKRLLSILDSHDLVDIWRIQHPDTIRYTRREKTRSGFKQSRIDYFLISCCMCYLATLTSIKPSI